MIKWIIYIFFFFSLNNVFGFTPPTIISGAINSVTSVTSSASANITGDGGSAITSRGFVWSTSNSLPTISSYDGITANGTSLGAFTHSINALCPGTSYYIRPYATNSSGTSYGSVNTFTTSTSSGDFWTQKTNLSGSSRDLSSAFEINYKIYISCGRVSGFDFLNDLWEYDIFSDTWTQKANFGGAERFATGATACNGKGYVGFGMDESSVFLSDLWEYDPNLNSWSSLPAFPGQERASPNIFTYNNKVYVGMGAKPGLAHQDIYSYDPANTTWAFVTNHPDGNIGNCNLFMVEDKVYFGRTNFWQYDITNNQWTQKTNFPNTFRGMGNTFAIGKNGYWVGGEDVNSIVYNEVWAYNTISDSWQQKSNLPMLRKFQSHIGIGNKAYLMVGSTGGGTNDIWEYTPTTVPGITTIDVRNVTYKTANVNIIGDNYFVSCNSTIQAKGVVWSLTSNPTISNYLGIANSSANLSFATVEITGLTKLTTYYIRAYITTSNGTNYGNEISFLTTQSLEDSAPNNGDGNGDGIQDSQQDYVHSILNTFTNKYITIVSLNQSSLSNVEILSSSSDNKFSYPGSLSKFTISRSTARVKIYFHGISSLEGYIYRKKKANGEFFNFTNYTFGSEVIDGKTVATATLTLTDGGPEDYDGVVNGSITDPGGPAILATDANIPVWDWRWLTLLISLISIRLYKHKLSI